MASFMNYDVLCYEGTDMIAIAVLFFMRSVFKKINSFYLSKKRVLKKE
ncbi:conserved hypothetical protein [Oenococcus oeni]|nr:conserved hypothetical protein [Oenococcus oeni]